LATNNTWAWLLAFFFLDLIFTVVRAGLAHARLSTLMVLREKQPAGVERVVRLLEKPTLRITLHSLGVIIHFLLTGTLLLWLTSWLVGLSGVGILLLLLLLAALITLLVEFALESIVDRDNEGWAVRVAWIADLAHFFLRPFSWLMQRLLSTSGKAPRSINAVTEDELKSWVEEGQAEGVLEQGERQMIYSIFHFSDKLSREIMVPRIDVIALEADISLADAIREITLSGHSRVPVYDDVIDNILGVVYAKDLLVAKLDGDPGNTVRGIMRPAYFVPEAKRVGELLKEMQARGVHIAIVIDEYGGMAGLVTLEDIVEEIVGEIRDEYDQSEELLYLQVSADEYTIQGRIDLDDLNQVLGTHLTKEIADTLGGFIYSEIGRIPVEGEQVKVEDWILTVEKVTGRRIRLVRALRQPPVSEKENGEGE
jgi:putative hemolysin